MKKVSFKGKGISLDKHRKRIRRHNKPVTKSLPQQQGKTKKQPEDQKLRYFWNQIRKNTPNRIKLLKEFSEIKISSKDLLTEKRIRFNKDINLKRAKKCFVCKEKADIRHHIILLRNGGKNIPLNIISLCNKCHEGRHPWLKEERLVNGQSRLHHSPALTSVIT